MSDVIHNLALILQRMYEIGVKGRLRRRIIRYMAEDAETQSHTLSIISKNVHSSPSNVCPAIRWLLKNGFLQVLGVSESNTRASTKYDITPKGIVFVLGFIQCDCEKVLKKYSDYMPFINEATFLPNDVRHEIIKALNIVAFLSVDFSDPQSVKYTWPTVAATMLNAYMPYLMQYMKSAPKVEALTPKFRKSICGVADRFDLHAKILRKFAKCDNLHKT